ncbi:hypothetical protein [Caldifermentibacillus hisashii]|uniref:hypothetical protein n=1 Tax=Caldifermentibacillus hisashii TaxID=996558 RepID=UPI003CC7214C
MFQKAGFPKDVIQIAHGGKEVGAALTAGNPDYIFLPVRSVQEKSFKRLPPKN